VSYYFHGVRHGEGAAVARIDTLLTTALKALPPKPAGKVTRSQKKKYSEDISRAIASTFAEELRARGLKGTRPALPGVVGKSGAERRMAGALGAKKVDVTWATEESGLVFAASIKSINWKDGNTGNYQKNLTNRRGDMLFESVTLHRRFPYAVLAGFVFLDQEAAQDGTAKRHSTFVNAHSRLRLFTGRDDPAGRDEQYEQLYVILLDANPFAPKVTAYAVGDHATPVAMEKIFDNLVASIAERNPDFYEFRGGNLDKASK
jgi:hypothetical protein